ncbi:hypothetical protein BsWGS_21473 [Bradybaena similaris]
MFKKRKMRTITCLAFLLAGACAGHPDYDDEKRLTKAINNFSNNISQKITVGEPNSIYSPLSIHQALSMTYLGARGETAKEILNTLGLNAVAGEVNELYKNVCEQLNSATEVELLPANAIFLNPKKEIDANFSCDARYYYKAEVSSLDFLAPGGPEQKINDFVSNKTKGLVTDLLKPGSIDDSTILALINTLFFNGTWQKQFSITRTQKSDFNTPKGIIQIDTMFDEQRINLKRNYFGADVGEIIFRGGRFSLVIFLSGSADGLPSLEESLKAPGRLSGLFKGLKSVLVKLSLPKIKLQSTYELNTALQDLGIVKAFNPIQADFTGISSAGGIFISKVLHKAVIEVIETGTVAAAATSAIISPRKAAPPPPVETFYVNNPFVYFIYDRQLQLIVFSGKYSE